MKKKFLLIYICAAMAVFLILAVSFSVIAYRSYSGNSAKGHDIFGQIENTVKATYLINDKFTPAFRKNINAFFNFDRKLLGVMVKDSTDRLIYCHLRHDSLVKNENSRIVFTAGRYNSIFQGPVNLVGSAPLKLEVKYRTLDRERLVYMIKSLIIFILVSVILFAGIFIISSEEMLKRFRIRSNTRRKGSRPLPVKAAAMSEYGFADRRYFEMTLTDTLSEASSLDRDLSLAEIRFNEKPDPSVWKITGEAVVNIFSSSDLVFEGKKDSFHIIFPDKTLKEALRLVTTLFQEVSMRTGKNILYAGITSRNGRLLTPGRLLSEADTALSKADDEENIIALETDPDRYRDFVNNNL